MFLTFPLFLFLSCASDGRPTGVSLLLLLKGPFIVAIVGFAINPWQLLNTANVFM
jgi:cytosine/uracil/thiamine/allantoin permease